MNEVGKTSTAGPNSTQDPTARPRLARSPATMPVRPVRKFSTSIDPDSTPMSNLDPVLTRKGATAHKGILVMALVGVGVMGYAFNVGGMQVTLDAFFDSVNKSAQSQNSFVVSTIITIAPYVGSAIVGLLAYALLRAIFNGFKSMGKSRRLSKRRALSENEFVEMAGERGVSGKVSREAYRLLLPHYQDQMRAKMEDNLQRDLQLTHHDAIDLYAGLLRKSDRHLKAVENTAQPETVLELLKAVEIAPVRSAAPHPPRPKPGIRDRSVIRPITKL